MASGDSYSAYNKPGSVMHWLAHTKVDAEWIVFIDADMIIRRPFTPRDVGAKKGRPVAGYYGYLNGVKNRMASMFLPKAALPFADQVGGWTVMHVDDLRRVAPLWRVGILLFFLSLSFPALFPPRLPCGLSGETPRTWVVAICDLMDGVDCAVAAPSLSVCHLLTLFFPETLPLLLPPPK